MTVDTAKPAVAITSPADGATLGSTSVVVSGTASDDVAVEKVELSLDGTNYVLATGTTSWSGTLTLAEGPNTTFARATDTASNNATVAVTVTVRIPAPTPVVVYHPWSGSERTRFLPVLDAFTTATGILVEDRTFRQEELQTILPAQFSASQTPADVIFMASSFIRDWGDQGWAMDVSGLVDTANFVPNSLVPVTSGTTIYGGAYTFKVKPGFWYKDSHFTARGWDDNPAAYSAFVSLLQTIQANGTVPIVSGDGVGWPLSDVTEHFIATYGGAQMHKDLTAGTLSWTDPSVKAIFTDFLVPILTAGYFDTPVEWTAGVSDLDSEKNALYFQGSWLPSMAQTSNESDIRAMPAPGGVAEAQRGVVVAVDYLFVPAFTSRPAEAQQLFQFLIGATGQTVQIQQGGHFATNLDADLTRAPPTYDQVRLVGDRQLLSDLDDTIGGTFQTTFWSQLQLLWADPAQLDAVLATIEAAR